MVSSLMPLVIMRKHDVDRCFIMGKECGDLDESSAIVFRRIGKAFSTLSLHASLRFPEKSADYWNAVTTTDIEQGLSVKANESVSLLGHHGPCHDHRKPNPLCQRENKGKQMDARQAPQCTVHRGQQVPPFVREWALEKTEYQEIKTDRG